MSKQRTIDKAIRRKIVRLAQASVELLSCARLMAWECGQDKKADTSIIECMERMAQALEGLGLPQVTLQEFYVGVEEVLSGKRPIIKHDLPSDPH